MYLSRLLGAAVALALLPMAAHAQDSGAKQLRLVIGTDVGGSYDLTGRLMARHLPRFLPGAPSIVPQNMPGAGGIVAANFLYNLAPKDGTTFGVIVPQTLLSQLFGEEQAKFEAEKFHWLGNPLGSAAISAVFHTSPAKTWKEARDATVLMGATGASGPDAFAVRLANATLGTRFKLITGYKGGNDLSLALERGEIHGRGSQTMAGWKATNPDWVATRKIIPLWQMSVKPDPELPGVPMLHDLVEGEENKIIVRIYSAISSLGRPFLAPPGSPAEQVALLREAFARSFKDAEFAADAKKVNIELGPITGEELQSMMKDFASVDAGLRAKMKRVLSE